jgi:RND family efflux transporter MFP subunit
MEYPFQNSAPAEFSRQPRPPVLASLSSVDSRHLQVFRMKQLAQGVLRYIVLIAITMAAIGVMIWASGRGTGDANQHRVAPVAAVARGKPLVAAETLKVEQCELTATFTGKVRPWETYTLGFEVAGRVVALGNNPDGKPLDDGNRVARGQTLARMDDRIFNARKSEAVAKLEEATTEMTRARTLRERNAMTETEFQEQLTELALARAQHEVALKNLDDSVLISPVDATIARRYVNEGETVQPNEMAFELVEDDQVLLVVDVPESQVYGMLDRLAAVEAHRVHGIGTAADPEDHVFRAYVTLEGRDRFGRVQPMIPAEVYRIAQIADARTGLFEVEVRVPNHDRALRSGMVATARIVADRLPAYRIPETAVMFRDRDAYLFALRTCHVPLEVMFWEAATTDAVEVHRVDLERWIDQGPYVLVPADEYEFDQIVVRGQQRLTDGQLVRVSQTGGRRPEAGVSNAASANQPTSSSLQSPVSSLQPSP